MNILLKIHTVKSNSSPISKKFLNCIKRLLDIYFTYTTWIKTAVLCYNQLAMFYPTWGNDHFWRLLNSLLCTAHTDRDLWQRQTTTSVFFLFSGTTVMWLCITGSSNGNFKSKTGIFMIQCNRYFLQLKIFVFKP